MSADISIVDSDKQKIPTIAPRSFSGFFISYAGHQRLMVSADMSDSVK
jgi:hypothetical protein